MTTLVIVESPGKLKKLREILAGGYDVSASVGHVRDLPVDRIAVDPSTYRPEYVETERGREVLAKLRQQVAKAKDVLLAMDPDREGEAIAWHLADALSLANPRRVTFQEITAQAVKRAVSGQARPLDMHLVSAQEARRVLDRFVGYTVSPAISRKQGQRLSAGRVQSPAVRLVVDRERAIRAFVPTKHFGAKLFFGRDAPWFAEWDVSPFLRDGERYLLDQDLAREAAAARRARVEDVKEGRTNAPPPPPFITSTLQQAAQATLKFKPKKTMELAQSLYEQGAISYHRTDMPNLSAEAEDAVAEVIRARGWTLPAARRKWKAKEGAQEAHEAIRPTHPEHEDAGETDDEKALYRLIWSRTVACQMPDASFAVREVEMTAECRKPTGGVMACRYVARGKTLVAKGWKVVYQDEAEDDDEDESTNPVPTLAPGDVLDVIKGEVVSKTTKAPSRFTEATLIKEMESLGIGRPSTYAAILENIQARKYVEADRKGFLLPLPAGEVVVDALVGKCSFIELDFTRDLEAQLDQVAAAQLGYDDVVRPAAQLVAQQTAGLSAVAGPPCPDCGKTHGGSLRRVDLKGKGIFWGCSRYAEGCKATHQDSGGKPLITACPVCGKAHGGRMNRIKGPKGFFWGCSRYSEGCKASMKDKSGKPDTKTLRK